MTGASNKRPMTRDGYQRLRKEYDELSTVERPRVVQGVSNAAAEGDRSENAEYIYGKKRLREIDKRLQYLASLIRNVNIIDDTDLSGDRVCFAAAVVVRDEDGKRKKWKIVGDGEADIKAGSISYTSSVGRALLGKRVSDVIEVEAPKGTFELEIVAIYFGDRLIVGSDE